MLVNNTSNNLLPFYPTDKADSLDLRINIEDDVVLQPFEIKRIGTGLRFKMPEHRIAQITTKGSFAESKHIVILNAPVNVESNYTDEIYLLLMNMDSKEQVLFPHEVVGKITFLKSERDELINTMKL